MQSGLVAIRRTLSIAIALLVVLIIVGIVQSVINPTPEADSFGVEIPEGHQWLLFDFQAAEGNANTEGTVVTLELERETLTGEVSADSDQLFFDLGEVETVGDVLITWADGRTQRYNAIPLNARYEIDYPDSAGTALRQWVQLYGPSFQLSVYVIFGILVVLFGVRVLAWAENRPEPVAAAAADHHNEHAAAH